MESDTWITKYYGYGNEHADCLLMVFAFANFRINSQSPSNLAGIIILQFHHVELAFFYDECDRAIDHHKLDIESNVIDLCSRHEGSSLMN